MRYWVIIGIFGAFLRNAIGMEEKMVVETTPQQASAQLLFPPVYIPAGVPEIIFSHLSYVSLTRTSRVCRGWRTFMKDYINKTHTLWVEKMAAESGNENYFNKYFLSRPKGLRCKTVLDDIVLTEAVKQGWCCQEYEQMYKSGILKNICLSHVNLFLHIPSEGSWFQCPPQVILPLELSGDGIQIMCGEGSVLYFSPFFENFKQLTLAIIGKGPKKIYGWKHLKNLTPLNLSGNNLEQLPEEIGEAINLKYLDISNNLLSELPESFKKLRKLEYFNYANNRFTSIPPAVIQLTVSESLEFLTRSPLLAKL